MHGQHDFVARDIERLADEWMTAVAERDAATLVRILAEEFRLASGLGIFVDRAEWLRMAMHDVEVESFAYSDVTIRSYGDVAVMQSNWRQNARLRGKDWSGEGLLTDIWVRRDGRWQVAARHSSLVSNPAGAAAADGNAHTIRRLFDEVFNAGHIAAVDELTTADVLGHDATNPEPRRGREAVRQVALLFRSAFPDLRLTLDDLVAAGDKVAARWTLKGTHRGAFMGAAPTGRRATTGGIVIYRLEGGRIAEYWGSFDALGLLRQLGALPPPANAPSTNS